MIRSYTSLPVKIEMAMQDMIAPRRRLAYKAQISHLIN